MKNPLHKTIKGLSVLIPSILLVLYFTSSKEMEPAVKVDYSYCSPKTISFCGEQTPLSDPLVYESLDREIIINAYWHSRTIQVIKRANKYFPIIEPILDSMKIPQDVKYLAVIESALLNATSPSGAKGFWQFLEATGKEYGMEINDNIDERLNLEKATVAACKYLQKSFDEFGSWSLAAAAYNMGQNGVRSVIETQQINDYYQLHLNDETGRYVYRILSTKYIFENAEKLGFEWAGMKKYNLPEFKSITISESIPDLRQYCTANGYSYKKLKAYNPWLITEKFIAKPGKSYVFLLPQ